MPSITSWPLGVTESENKQHKEHLRYYQRKAPGPGNLPALPAGQNRTGGDTHAGRRADGTTPPAKLRSTADLESEPDNAGSDPAASKAVLRTQAKTATDVISGTDESGTSLFAQAENQTIPETEPADHLVENPIEEEQRSDLQTPEGFEPGSEVPEVPDFSSQEPTETRELPNGGGTEETFEQDGVTYTRTRRPDGSVNTAYEVDGVNYSSTTLDDGSNSTFLSTSGDEGTHTRTIETDGQGNLRTDSYSATQAETDPETGEITLQSREETLDAEGVRTEQESVVRPDGGRAELTRTEQPDGSVREVYTFDGEQGTVNRTTNTLPDGSGETRTEKNYTSEQSLEELTGGITPPIPEHADGVVPLPQDGRGDTSVREVEVVSIDANGNEELQYSEESYSQSSSDVQLRGSQELDQQRSGDTFPQGIFPDDENSNVTHTVTRVRARNEEGELEESSGASQTVTLAGNRHEAFGGGDVSVTRTDSWNSAGESSSSFSQEGFQEGDLYATSRSSDDLGDYFQATVGDRHYSAGWPSELGRSPFDHYNLKGGGEVDDWIGAGAQDPLDVGVTVSRDAEGNVTDRSVTYSTVGDDGEGKTVTRSEQGGAVGWTYTNFENGGDDYQRQTVFEGTDISVYESHQVTGPGEFVTTSETREGDTVVAESEATRSRLDEEQLRQYVADGQLTQEQYDRMLQDGPPYFAEQYVEHAEPLTEDGELRRDENGDPIQTGHDVTSLTLSNGSGYGVSEHFRQNLGEDGLPVDDSRLSTVTDPTGNPPVTGHLQSRERDSETGRYTVTEEGDLMVQNNGRFYFDGEEVGQFDFGGADLSDVMRDNQSLSASDLVNVLGKAARSGQRSVLLSRVAGGRFNLTGDTGNLSRLAGAADIFGLAAGTAGLFDGLQQRNGRAVVQGLGDIAGGVNSLAAATSALARGTQLAGPLSRFSTLTSGATALGKTLGAAGGVISLGFGLYDVFNAESGHDRAAGGLTAAAGAVALGSAFFGPPGWIIGGVLSGGLGIAAVLVGAGDDHDTAPIDDRLR